MNFTFLDSGLCEEFQRPYLELLPSDPSFEDVKKVVLTERKRPSIPMRWEEHEVRTSYRIILRYLRFDEKTLFIKYTVDGRTGECRVGVLRD